MEAKLEFKRVLVAFDGSEYSVKAVKAACALAKRLGSSLTLVHIFSVPVYAYGGPAGVPAVSVEALEGGAKSQANAMLEKGLKLAESESMEAKGEAVESGSVVEAIVNYAAKQKMDLVVIGTRGMTGFRKMLLGSVSTGVVIHAPCPVLVVR
jgi:nucleotide-binding universal stress UspA family protein